MLEKKKRIKQEKIENENENENEKEKRKAIVMTESSM